jgi:hypothetical protein
MKMNKKLNGYAKWVGITIGIGTIIFSTGITYQKIKNIEEKMIIIEQRLEKIEQRLWNERSKK